MKHFDDKIIETIGNKRVKGVSGDSVTAACGRHELFGPCLIASSSPFNLLSWSKLRGHGFNIEYHCDDNNFKISKKDICDITFSESADGLYRARVGKYIDNGSPKWTNVEFGYNLTLENRIMKIAKGLSDQQRQQAYNARKLHKQRGHCSDSVLSKMLKAGTIKGCSLTPVDLHNANLLFGKCTSCARAKKRKKINRVKRLPSKLIGEIVHVDVVFFDKIKYLIGVDDATDFIVGTIISTRSKEDIFQGLVRIINAFKSNGHVVHQLSSDREGGIIASQDQLNALKIRLYKSSSDGHAPVVERQVRTLREKMLAIMNDIDGKIPEEWIPYLISYTIQCCNNVSNSKTGVISPADLVLGKTMDNDKFGEFIFGDIVLCRSPYLQQQRHFVNRAEFGIMLGRDILSPGVLTIYQIKTGKLVHRSDAETGHSLPSEELMLLKRKLSKSIIFQPDIDNHFHPSISNTIQNVSDAFEGCNRISANANDITASLHRGPGLFNGVNDNDLSNSDEINDLVSQNQLEKDILTNQDYDEGINSNDEGINTNEETKVDGEIDDLEQKHDEISNILPLTVAIKDINSDISTNNIITSRRSRSSTKLYSPGDTALVATNAIESKDILDTGMMIAAENAHVAIFGSTNENDSITEEEAYLTLTQTLEENSVAVTDAVLKEIKSILQQNTCTLIPVNSVEDAVVIPTSVVVVEKNEGLYKARIVAGGNKQDKSIYHVYETSSPTIRVQSLMILLTIAATEGLQIFSMDVTSAYLKAKLPESRKIVIRFNKTITDMMRTVVDNIEVDHLGRAHGLLNKALYGLLEAGRLWYELLCSILIKAGYKKTEYDGCVFKRWCTITESWCYIGVYVDDLILLMKNKDEFTRVKSVLESHLGTMKYQDGKEFIYRGLMIRQCNGNIYLNQHHLIRDILDKNNVIRKAKTPHTAHLFEEKTPDEVAKHPNAYRELVAQCLWLSTQSRPDIKLVMSKLTSKMDAPSADDERKLYRLLEYLNYSIEDELTFKAGDMQLRVFADAGHLVRDDCKGQTGFIIKLGSSTIDSISKKQSIHSMSSSESELISLNSSLSHYLWCLHFVNELGYHQQKNKFYQDNKSTINMSENGKLTQRTIHMKMRYYRIHDYLKSGLITILYLATENMCADLFTKPLELAAYKRHQRVILGSDEQTYDVIGCRDEGCVEV